MKEEIERLHLIRHRYAKLDYGWTNSIFGCITLGIGLPAVSLLWRYGKKLRQKSPYCANED